ncbi:MAG: peroxiredoxin [Sterolibacterium sp.]
MNIVRRLMLLASLLSPLLGHAAPLPATGSVAPEFSLPDQNGKTWRLADLRGRWVVLYFYPKDDTPGCTEEACQFRDDLAALQALDAQILGVSVDDSASHAAFAKKHSLQFPLLADADGRVADAYGALTDWKLLKLAKRYTFLIDPQGRLAKVYLKVDTSRHSAEIIADLKLLKRK